MASHNVQVFVRLRPEHSTPLDALQVSEDSTHIELEFARGTYGLVTEDETIKYEFKYQHVFGPTSSQEDVFDTAVKPCVGRFCEGFSATVFAYGQTGAGKTFTMLGHDEEDEHLGMCQRAIQTAFRQLKSRGGGAEMSLSCIEIYNDTISDLLLDRMVWDFVDPEQAAQVQSASPSPKLVVSDAGNGSAKIDGLTIREVPTAFDALELLRQAIISRSRAGHVLNQESSRSHFICTVYSECNGVQSKLHLVDLAGSERIKKSRSEGMMAQEAAHINKSLLALEQVVIALTKPGSVHTPYRQSELTHFLKDALGGSSYTSMISCLWPHAAQAWECLSTLRLSARMTNVLITPVISYNKPSGLMAAQEQIRELRRQLAARDLIIREHQTCADSGWQGPLSAEQSQVLREELRVFVLAEDSAVGDGSDRSNDVVAPPGVRSTVQVHAQLHLMKRIVTAAAGSDADMLMAVLNTVLGPPPSIANELAVVPPPDRCVSSPPSPPHHVERQLSPKQANGAQKTSELPASPTASNVPSNGRAHSFEFFVENEPAGIALYSRYTELKDACKTSRESLKVLARELNDHKLTIDKHTSSLSEQHSSPEGDAESIAELLKITKRKYRHVHLRLSEAQSQAASAKAAQDEAMQQLIRAYDDWRGDNDLAASDGMRDES